MAKRTILSERKNLAQTFARTFPICADTLGPMTGNPNPQQLAQFDLTGRKYVYH